MTRRRNSRPGTRSTAQLGFHDRPGHDWIDTLNRLWRKNRFVMSMDGMLKLPQAPPVLTREMLTVTPRAMAARAARAARARRTPTTARGRSATTCPILLLEWQGRHFLIDGINRINRRMRERLAGPHEVIVIHGRTP